MLEISKTSPGAESASRSEPIYGPSLERLVSEHPGPELNTGSTTKATIDLNWTWTDADEETGAVAIHWGGNEGLEDGPP